ncbi:MAG: integration host factor subunit alpha [Myxococcaceae bacterium]|nr:integration host factor subunit alpha [Myxococcaceae bacterium]
MTKADIIERLYGQVGLSRKESGDVVELVFDAIKATLERGEKVKISGFGNFVVREKAARVGRNPQTGDAIEITARRVLSFRPSQVLKTALNEGSLPVDAPATGQNARSTPKNDAKTGETEDLP